MLFIKPSNSYGPMEIRYISISISSLCAELSQACRYKSVISALGRLRQKGHRFNIGEITRLSHKSRDFQVSNDLTEIPCGDLEETAAKQSFLLFVCFQQIHLGTHFGWHRTSASSDLVSLLFI